MGPRSGCSSDEVEIQIQGIQGAVCSPACKVDLVCPGHKPPGVRAKPLCMLHFARKKYCALVCNPSAKEDQCGTNASCKRIQAIGICTYDDNGKDIDETDKRTTMTFVASESVV